MVDMMKAMLLGPSIAKRLIAEHPGMQMIFTFESIGDQCMELAYLRAYQKENQISRIGVLTTNPNHAVFQYFSGAFDELIKITTDEYKILLKFYKSDAGQIFRRKFTQILCAFYTSYVRSDLLFDNKYLRLSDIEKLIYHIPPNTLPCSIKKLDFEKWVDSLIDNGRIIPDKTILLNPYANSCAGVPFSFFENLVKYATNNGFTVITGVHGDQIPIKGTEGVTFSLDRTISLVEKCGYVVGLRSGFLDLCAFSNAKIVSVDHESYNLADATKLEDWWPQNQNIKTFRYKENEDKLIPDIVSYLLGGER